MFQLKRTTRDTDAFEDEFWKGGDLNELYQSASQSRTGSGLEHIFTAGFREYSKHRRQGSNAGGHARQRAPRDARRLPARDRRARRAPRRGSRPSARCRPYIGLFGTVWGIMNAFRGLANVSQATLAQVAPGHRRGADRHRDRPLRRDSRGRRVQPLHARRRPARGALRDLHRGVLEHPAAAGLRRPRTPPCAAPRKSINQINVVPYIDVMLVLLVIFMVTAPLVEPGRDRAAVGRQQADGAGAAAARSRCAPTARCRSRDQQAGGAGRAGVARRARRAHPGEAGEAPRPAGRHRRRPAARATRTCSSVLDLLQRNGVRKVGLLARPPADLTPMPTRNDRAAPARTSGQLAGACARDRRARRVHRRAGLLDALAEPAARAGHRRALRAAAEGGGRRAPAPPAPAPPPSRSPTRAQAAAASPSPPKPEPRRRRRRRPRPSPSPRSRNPIRAPPRSRSRRKAGGRAQEARRRRPSAKRKEREKKEAEKREAEKKKQDEQKRVAEARERQAREAEALQGAGRAREGRARRAQQKADARTPPRARAPRRITSGASRRRSRATSSCRRTCAGNPEAIFDVVQLPTGEIIDAVLRKSSGVRAYDEAVQRAILKSSPLPRPDRPELFQRTLTLKFRPQD